MPCAEGIIVVGCQTPGEGSGRVSSISVSATAYHCLTGPCAFILLSPLLQCQVGCLFSRDKRDKVSRKTGVWMVVFWLSVKMSVASGQWGC